MRVCVCALDRNQNTFVIQSRDLVVTRLAMPPLITPEGWNLEAFLTPIVNAFPEVPGRAGKAAV